MGVDGGKDDSAGNDQVKEASYAQARKRSQTIGTLVNP